ncbi:MAG: CcmD family protein [Chitinophagaceae bacterium]
MKHVNWKKILTAGLLLSITVITNAQDGEKKTGDFMRSIGRSYVVIAVMLTILTGLILYLVRLERKIRKLEKEN